MSSTENGSHTKPELSKTDRTIYSQPAQTMSYYHNHFRHVWQIIYSSVSPDADPAKRLSTPALLRTIQQLIGNLTAHHQIEEAHIFPILAERMPFFRPESTAYTQHKGIHEGLDKLEEYVSAVRSGERELRREEVKQIMDSFGETLWEHLEEEVRELDADKFWEAGWTRAEISQLPL